MGCPGGRYIESVGIISLKSTSGKKFNEQNQIFRFDLNWKSKDLAFKTKRSSKKLTLGCLWYALHKELQRSS